jgi:hypothetical protein
MFLLPIKSICGLEASKDQDKNVSPSSDGGTPSANSSPSYLACSIVNTCDPSASPSFMSKTFWATAMAVGLFITFLARRLLLRGMIGARRGRLTRRRSGGMASMVVGSSLTMS